MMNNCRQPKGKMDNSRQCLSKAQNQERCIQTQNDNGQLKSKKQGKYNQKSKWLTADISLLKSKRQNNPNKARPYYEISAGIA